MNLDDAQKKKVTEWIAEGLKLSEIQKRLGDELGLRLTYMEARLLVDDLKLMPKDTERPKPLELSGKPVDQIARPGAVVSGSVTFSDGNIAAWYLDQFGRLGLAPKKQGYKPPAGELQEFQTALQNELAKL